MTEQVKLSYPNPNLTLRIYSDNRLRHEEI